VPGRLFARCLQVLFLVPLASRCLALSLLRLSLSLVSLRFALATKILLGEDIITAISIMKVCFRCNYYEHGRLPPRLECAWKALGLKVSSLSKLILMLIIIARYGVLCSVIGDVADPYYKYCKYYADDETHL